MKKNILATATDQTNETCRKPTRRDEFLKVMNAFVARAALCEFNAPKYPKFGTGRLPIGLELMLRIHFIQQWFNLADLFCEEALFDNASLRELLGIDLGRRPTTHSSNIAKALKLLKDNNFGTALITQGGWDPDMHHAWNGQQWYFGTKQYSGAESQSGLTYSAVVKAANLHDKHALPELLRGKEQCVYDDSALVSQKDLIVSKAAHAKNSTRQNTQRNGVMDEVLKGKTRDISRMRGRGAWVRCGQGLVWGFGKVRCRWQYRNSTRPFAVLTLTNIYLNRQSLMKLVHL